MVDSTKQIQANQKYSGLVHDLQVHGAPRQRMLFSLLAICDKHQVALPETLRHFSDDLPRTPLEPRRRTGKFFWSQVRQFADDVEEESVPATLPKYPLLLPRTTVVAKTILQEKVESEGLYDAWLNRQPDGLIVHTPQRTFISMVFPVLVQAWVVATVFSFLLIFIVPQLREMTEEFEMPETLVTTDIMESGLVDELMLVPYALLLLLLPFTFILLHRFFRSWNPFVWMNPAPSRPSEDRLILSILSNPSVCSEKELPDVNWADQYADCLTAESNAVDWEKVRKQRLLAQSEIKALEEASSTDVQSWLLQEFAIQKETKASRRTEYWAKIYNALLYAFVGFVILFSIMTVFLLLVNMLMRMTGGF